MLSQQAKCICMQAMKKLEITDGCTNVVEGSLEIYEIGQARLLSHLSGGMLNPSL